MAGLEIALEEDTWRLLWGTQTYQDLLQRAGAHAPYSVFIRDYIGPTIHPRDREQYCQSMGTLGPAVHLPGGPSPGPSGVPGKGGPGPGL